MLTDAASPAGLPRPEHVEPVALATLVPAQASVDQPAVLVTGITATSGKVRPGDLFAALPGTHTHGARFAAAALSAGAAAVLTDAAGRALVPAGVPVLEVADVRSALGPIASRVYGDPSTALRVLAVTGTSGKTTTTFFLRAALAAAGRTAGLIGTVATYVGHDELKTGFTTPEAPDVHALLAVMRERGVTDVAMEVSSHALELGRVGGVAFDVAGFTNLSQDHLDFHPDMEAYFRAKARLFEAGATPVIVVDDEWGRRLRAELGADVATVSTLARADTTWWVSDVVERAEGATQFVAHARDIAIAASTVIPGRFNVTNALLAIAMLDAVGIDAGVAAAAIATATVPGRMERVDAGQAFLAVVDYSHKPAAVDGALRALRPLTRGRLVVVLGCGGDRDHAKRPVMGEIAARGSDVLVVTDDNPRSEDPAVIRGEMLAGALAVPASERGEVLEVGDRAQAIAVAVGSARAGDTVLVAGKGHETGQEVAGVVHPFDDRSVLRAALEAARP
ncbi:MAG TPA: UDP-N-acetylmuramoyl-L-alanyl-D-glutamate--2,6-diaminopimelate ligase [Jatrophihabitantaceae bacterium]|nr:UDP-N-acetylmuramoyl-L-alanyl-D-glutamate--2,6-diaminopimelate ligase [Jatrophihabitantaceae bacterium]